MNWLIYIGGWVLGIALLTRLFPKVSDSAFTVIGISWTISWLWICLKFIK